MFSGVNDRGATITPVLFPTQIEQMASELENVIVDDNGGPHCAIED